MRRGRARVGCSGRVMGASIRKPYVRFHGTARYDGGYDVDRLRGWAHWLDAQRADGCDVYAYFNNDTGGHAPRDAATLRGLLQP